MIILLKALFNKDQDIKTRVCMVQNGDKHERERLISDYQPFIINIVSRETGKFVQIGDSDELSVGLIAFNEAIDKYDENKYNSFLSFADQVIKNRLIDYYRKEKKSSSTIPISYLNEIYESEEIEEKLFIDNSQTDMIDAKIEIEDLEKSLKSFGISLEDLVENSPKHKDTRINAVKIGSYIAQNEFIMEKMMNKKKIPSKELQQLLNISKKVIHKNKNFIIAVSLILKSNNDIMKSYVHNLLKEVK